MVSLRKGGYQIVELVNSYDRGGSTQKDTMRPGAVVQHTKSLPYMRLEQGQLFYEFILENQLGNCLELGFLHGVSSAYIAGALQDLGFGHLMTIDLISAKDRKPNIEEVLAETQLRDLVTIFYEPRSFNWRLMRLLQQGRQESFDLCYIDGGHNWYDTGFAFCLVERLLKPGGWVVFDDLSFTYRQSSMKDKQWVKRMPEEEQVEQQVRLVFELLVETNPNFGTFRTIGQLAFAQKCLSVTQQASQPCDSEELLISRVLKQAKFDPELRSGLLLAPARTMAEFFGADEARFAHLYFEETDNCAPLGTAISEHGSKIIFIEPPSWERLVTEESLEAMLHE